MKNVEDVGVYEKGDGIAIVLKNGNGRPGEMFLYKVDCHSPEVYDIFNNRFNKENSVLKAVSELGERKVAKQYVSKDGMNRLSPEYRNLELLDQKGISTVEFEDGRKLGPVLTGCVLPLTLLSGGEIMIEDSLWTNDKKFEEKIKDLKNQRGKVKSRISERYNGRGGRLPREFVEGLIETNLNSIESELNGMYESFREVESNAKFKGAKKMVYAPTTKHFEVKENGYSILELVDAKAMASVNVIEGPFPMTGFQMIESSLFGVYRDGKSDKRYNIKIGPSTSNMANLARWTEIKGREIILKQSKELERKKDQGKLVIGCGSLVNYLLKDSGITMNEVYLHGDISEKNIKNLFGKGEKETEFTPQRAFVSLSGKGGSKVVEAPVNWAMSLGLDNSKSLKMKIDNGNGEAEKPEYIV